MGEVARIVVPNPPALTHVEDGVETQGQIYLLHAPSVATEPMVVRAPTGETLRLVAGEMYYRDALDQWDVLYGSAPASVSATGRQARYERPWPLGDDVFVAEAERVKHYAVIHRAPRPPAAYLGEGTELGVTWLVSGERLPVGRHDSIQVGPFTLPRPWAQDTAGERVYGYYEVADIEDGLQQLYLWLSADWLLSEERVYPVTVDPTVGLSDIANATAYPGQCKIVRFPNDKGTLLAVFADSDVLNFRYSTDGGQTWQQPPVGGAFAHGSTGAVVTPSLFLDSDGYVHLVYNATDSTVSAIYYRRGLPTFDSHGNITEIAWSPRFIVNQGLAQSTQCAVPDVTATPEPDGWFVHVVHSYYFSGSYRSVYARLWVASDGTITKVSDYTFGSYNQVAAHVFPTIRAGADKTLHAVWDTGGIGGSTLYVQYNRATYSSRTWTWQSSEQVIDRRLGFPCLREDSIGRAVVCWGTTDSTDSLAALRRRELGGGWTAIPLPASTMKTPVIALDKDDRVHFFYTNSGLKYMMHDGSAWSAEVTLDSDTTAAFPNVRRDTNGNAIDLLYRTGSASPYTVKSLRISLNTPPQQPTNLTRPPFDAAADALFTWQHNDEPGDGQARYQLQIRLAGSDTDLVDTGEVQSPLSQHLLPAGTLENGQTYQWRVRTADQSGEWSPWSDYAVFQTDPKPQATILYPTEGTTVSTSDVTVEWSVASQSAATIRLYDGAGQTVLQEHEVTTPSARARTITGLQNNTSYQVSVQPVSSIGVVGDEVFSGPFTVQYTPPPKPEVTAEGQQGFIRITITSPAHTGDEPEVTHNDLYRREPGQGWVRIATGIEPGGTYNDYATASGVIYEYRVRAIGANGTYSDSDVVAASLTITGGIWLHDPRDPSGTAHHFMYHELPSSDRSVVPSGTFQFAGRRYPVVQMDASQMERIVRYRLYLSDETDDRAALEALYERRTTLCLRNHRGKKYYVVFTEMPLEFERRGAWADVEFQVVDFDEEV